MIPIRKIYFILFFITSQIHLTAQHTTNPCNICIGHPEHQQEESPYEDFNLKNESAFIISSVGLLATSLIINTPAPLSSNDISMLNVNDINAFDRYATRQSSANAQRVSDIFLTGVLVLPTIFLSNHHTRKDILPLITMSAEIALINVAFTSTVKKLVRRTRPLAYNTTFPFEEKQTSNARLSFFSGHTSHVASLSFMMAKVMTDYHPHANKVFKVGIWTFAATLPAITGYLRVRAGKHFPTDVIGGYAFGGLVGFLVPHFHKKKKQKKWSFQPLMGTQTVGLICHF